MAWWLVGVSVCVAPAGRVRLCALWPPSDRLVGVCAPQASLEEAAALHRQQAAEQLDGLSARLETAQQQLDRAQGQLQQQRDETARLQTQLTDTAGRLSDTLGSLADTERKLDDKVPPAAARAPAG